MDNRSISKKFKLLGQLMELHGENEFKSRSILTASFRIDKLPFPLAGKSLQELSGIEGIGKSTAAKIVELLETGSMPELDTLLAATPEGVIAIMGIKGLGPKKVQVIWKELGIESVGELLYACNENRLIEAKGFGLKTQEEVKSAIEFKLEGSGSFLYAQVEEFAEHLAGGLSALFPDAEVSLTGEFRRRCEMIRSVEFIIGETNIDAESIAQKTGLALESESPGLLRLRSGNGLSVIIYTCSPGDFAFELFRTTGSVEHVEQVVSKPGFVVNDQVDEVGIYAAASLPFIEPELREGVFEFERIALGSGPPLITFQDLKGALHNHSTWSDGVNTLQEMALFCRDELKLDYLGISDHSKTAVYAKGLTEERVLAQHEEIEQLNAKLAPFRIFKGIESDILSDGSLDYPDEILATFDFIVASVHSAFKMDEDRATARLIKAIENPYTSILGHPSGRLLLSRKGYPVDFKRVIDACASNGVAIEVNANPLRLDLDWRWHRYATEKGVMLSINPDAHRVSGFYDMYYGVLAARKGGVGVANCLNALTREELEAWFTR